MITGDSCDKQSEATSQNGAGILHLRSRLVLDSYVLTFPHSLGRVIIHDEYQSTPNPQLNSSLPSLCVNPVPATTISTTTERISKELTAMKIFVRHLRTRPNIRSSLLAPPQASPAHYQPHPHVPEGVEAESLTRYKPPSKLSSPTRSALQESRIPASRQQLQQSQYRNRDYDAEEETSSYTPRQRSREYEEEEITSYSPRQHASRARPQSQPRYQSHEENDEVSAYSSRQRSPKSRAYEEDSGDYAHHSRTSKAESYAEIEPIERAPKPPKEPRVREPRLHLSDLIPESFTPYSYRWETLAPTPDELIDADRFFLKYPPKHLWSEAKFKKIDFGDVPEV
jgi:hypothetical protein